MPASKKHHYIPRFYLKGFTDANNKYYVFDKKTDKIWQSNPDNSFFENNRNTGILPHHDTGELLSSDLPEEMLSFLDDRAAKVLNNIRSSEPNEVTLTLDDLYEIRLFIISLFWRTPVNDSLRQDIIANSSFESLGFGIFHTETGARHPGIEEMLRNQDLWQKMYPLLLTFTPFSTRYKKLNANDWYIYSRGERSHVVTDNPIILEKFNDFSSLHEELIFPLSSRALLVSTKKYKPHIMAPVFSMKVDLMLFHLAGRYVASRDKSYLEFLAKEVKEKIDKLGWANKLKESLFNHFY